MIAELRACSVVVYLLTRRMAESNAGSLAAVARAQADAGGAHGGATCGRPLARGYGLLGYGAQYGAQYGLLGYGAQYGAPLGSHCVGIVILGAAVGGLGRLARRWRRSARDDAILHRRGE